MIRRAALVLLFFALPSFAAAIELVDNGGFEDDQTIGWVEETVGSSATIDRSVGYDPDPDFEIRVEKLTGNGHARLDQTVAVPSADAVFSAAVMIDVEASAKGGPWAAAGIALDYENYLGDALGTTMILRKTVDCPWIDSGKLHLIVVPDAAWNTVGFNLADELANLTDVDLHAVHQIRISLFGQVGGDC